MTSPFSLQPIMDAQAALVVAVGVLRESFENRGLINDVTISALRNVLAKHEACRQALAARAAALDGKR